MRDYIEALRRILKARPSGANHALTPYLEDKRELIRAIAACVLFEGTNRAKNYAPGMVRNLNFNRRRQ